LPDSPKIRPFVLNGQAPDQAADRFVLCIAARPVARASFDVYLPSAPGRFRLHHHAEDVDAQETFPTVAR